MTDIAELEDEIRNGEWYTVFGFWFESWERWAGFYQASSARQAEDLAQLDAKAKGTHLGVVAVTEGKVRTEDTYATWIVPDVNSQEEMDAIRRQHGYL